MLNGYHYEGPLPLGSVVAHNCGAAGLFSNKESPQVIITGEELNNQYTLKLDILDDTHTYLAHTKVFVDELTAVGRRKLGQALLLYLRAYQGLDIHSEWGTLVGVRPTKLYHKYLDTCSIEETKKRLKEEFFISDEKLDLLASVAHYQRPYIEQKASNDKRVAIYGGIPFCQTRCTYCSFPYGLIQDYPHIQNFKKSFIDDIEHMKSLIERYQLEIPTLYMGGGTPTSLDEDTFCEILQSFTSLVTNDCEYTIEAGRPDSITKKKILDMQRCGVNRVSINPQSLQDSILKIIGRGHTVSSITSLYTYIRNHTTFSINMDFIAGLPTQTMQHMIENIDYICKVHPENVTIHTLALKKGSPLYNGIGRTKMPSEMLVKEMVAYTKERLQAEGYIPYYLYRQQYMTGQLENIGYTLPNKECIYNIHIMEERQPVLSIGPGSSSKWMRGPDYRQQKQHMPKDVNVYISTLGTLLNKRESLSKKFWEVV